MVRKIIHSLIFILLSITCNSQKEIERYYYDLNLDQFSGLREITETNNLKDRRYIKVIYKDGAIKKIMVYDSTQKSYAVNVRNENGFQILKFPTRKLRKYEGNWFIFKNKVKSKPQWQIGNDTVLIINASKRKAQSANVAIIKLRSNDSLLIKSYSICCLDMDAGNPDPVAERQYLLKRISTDASITWHSYSLDLGKNILYSHRTNSTLAEEGISDGKPLTVYFPLAGGSLFWLLINYW